MELSELLVETLKRILDVLYQKQKLDIDPSALIKDHLQDILEISIKCLSVF